jgi:hypothetical protein
MQVMCRGDLFMVAAVGLMAAACERAEAPAPRRSSPAGAQPGAPGTGAGSGAPVTVARVNPIPIPPGILDLPALDRARRLETEALPFEAVATNLNICLAQTPVDKATVNVDRSLFVHDRATLDALGPNAFSLQRTLRKIAADAVAAGATGATAAQLFRDLWDTQNTEVSAATPAGAHCDDNGTTLNGFPNACRPLDGAQAKATNLVAEIAKYRPVGLVNRLDLAAEGWKNCGEHRIVYGREEPGPARSFIIFEAVLPNPRPGCESGCRGVAEHWYKLSSVSDPAERARRLERLYYVGIPGYRPVVHVDHYAARGASGGYSGGSGQVRTNQFLQPPGVINQPWMLKEFKLALDCSHAPCKLDAVPIPVKLNPDGNLWAETTAGLANSFQQSVVLPQVDQLAIDDVNRFTYQVPVAFDAARSQSSPPVLTARDLYREAYTSVPGHPGGFREKLASKAAASAPALTEAQVVNRAAALSCAGCHQPQAFGLTAVNSIGPGKSWPDSAAFVHVKAEASGGVHALSPALTTTFLPARAENLAKLLSDRACLCRFRKPGIDLTRIEREVLPRRPTRIEDLRDAEARLKRRIDTELVRQRKSKLPDIGVDLKARPLVLDEVKRAGADPVARARARRQAVQRLVTSEPPRKTVTGHFRVH